MILEILKAFLLGVVQGVTEWLPVSSTGHMILLGEFLPLNVTDGFMEMFRVVIQFGSILAVVILCRDRLFPWAKDKSKAEQKQVWTLWLRILIAAIPAAVIGLLFDDLLDRYLYNYITVAASLVIYGIAFIAVERTHRGKAFSVHSASDVSGRTAFRIGCFQLLSLIPGTSRSGSTILGAMCAGVSRTAAAEFSFFLAVPVMFGASFLKIVKYALGSGLSFTASETAVLLTGTVTAFAVSLIVIRFLMDFVRRHSFESFGWYRIALGLLVILYFAAAE